MRQRFASNKLANKINSDLAFVSQFIKEANIFNYQAQTVLACRIIERFRDNLKTFDHTGKTAQNFVEDLWVAWLTASKCAETKTFLWL